jgi:parallel beta-helix repeat protein
VLYVWRGDGNAPGPQYPIEAPLISTNLVAWGDAGPWVSHPPYVHLRGLVLRFCNASRDSWFLRGNAWPIVAVVGASNVIEQCDIEWGVWQGLAANGNGTITTNCVIANNGMLGLSTGQSNVQVVGNFFFNNGWRNYAGIWTEGSCWMGGSCADITLAGNVFSNNWGDAIHCDTLTTPPEHPIRILGNFIVATNPLPANGLGGGGISMEVSSSAWIINNVIVTSAWPGIFLGGSHGNRVLFNTCYVIANPSLHSQCLVLSTGISRDTDGITLHTYDAAFNLVGYNIFAGYGDGALVAVLQDSSASATSLGAICYSNTYVGNIFFSSGSQFPSQMNAGPAPYLGSPRPFINDAAGWAAFVCAGNPICSNSNNIVINPQFMAGNPVNFTTPTTFMLASNSPVRGYAPTNYNVLFDFAGNPRGAGSTAAGAFDNVTQP